MSSKVRGPAFREVVARAARVGSVSAVFFRRGAVGVCVGGATGFTTGAVTAGFSATFGVVGAKVVVVAVVVDVIAVSAAVLLEVAIVPGAIVAVVDPVPACAISFTTAAGVFMLGELEPWGRALGTPPVAMGKVDCTKVTTPKRREMIARPA